MSQNKFDTVEEAYRQLKKELVNFAKRQLINKEDAMDCVHDAFIKAIEYKKRNPLQPLNKFYILKAIKQSAYKRNRIDEKEDELDTNKHDLDSTGSTGRRITNVYDALSSEWD